MGESHKHATAARQQGMFVLALTAAGFVAFIFVASALGWMTF